MDNNSEIKGPNTDSFFTILFSVGEDASVLSAHPERSYPI